MIWVITLLVFLFLAKPVSAVIVTISNVPSQVSDQAFSFNVSLNCSGCGQSYLRANFFPTGTTNSYFGYSHSGTSFINSSTCTEYLPVNVDSSGNWSGTMQAKIDTVNSSYAGSGNYSFKVRRYTPSCSVTWSNEVIVNVSITSTTPPPSSSPSPSTSSLLNNTSFTISNIPSEVNSDQSFNVNISLSLPDYPNTKFYLKGAFKKSDSSNYFGLTKVGSSWIQNGSSYYNHYGVTTDSLGNWSGSLEIQPDILDSGYDGSREYIFKVGRYSDSGSGPTWSNEVNIKIIAKEIETEEGVVNLSGIGTVTKKEAEILGEDTREKSLPEEVYSLEKYRKLSSNSATPEVSPSAEVKSEKSINSLTILGTTLILGGLLATIIIYGIRKFRTRTD